MEKTNNQVVASSKNSLRPTTLDSFLGVTKPSKRKPVDEEEISIPKKTSKIHPQNIENIEEAAKIRPDTTNEFKNNENNTCIVETEVMNSENNIEKNKISLESLESFISGLGTWREHLSKFIKTDKMNTIYKFCKSEYSKFTVYPPQELIFNAFSTTTWQNLKVVIIGQDPYPNVGQAMGLSFSVNRGIPVPKSLLNIYKCLENDKKLNFKAPKHGDLSRWAIQGVFLLNATLTVIDKKANSHQKTSGWSDFTDYVIKTINDQKKGIVFLLWGNFAIAKKKLINCSKHFVIENIHPSPLAAAKGDFTKSSQFSDANEYLVKQEREPIDWNLPA
jgi:uracil-DNA glycosylase